MFLQPKKLKNKKVRQGRFKTLSNKKNTLKFGVLGLKSTSSGFVSARQLEAARRTMTRKLERKGKIWLRIFPDYPVTRKPNESRMGKGVGTTSFWAAKVRAGSLLFEACGGGDLNETKKALASGGHKLPLKTKVVSC